MLCTIYWCLLVKIAEVHEQLMIWCWQSFDLLYFKLVQRYWFNQQACNIGISIYMFTSQFRFWFLDLQTLPSRHNTFIFPKGHLSFVFHYLSFKRLEACDSIVEQSGLSSMHILLNALKSSYQHNFKSDHFQFFLHSSIMLVFVVFVRFIALYVDLAIYMLDFVSVLFYLSEDCNLFSVALSCYQKLIFFILLSVTPTVTVSYVCVHNVLYCIMSCSSVLDSFKTPRSCAMEPTSCLTIIGMWSVGNHGLCYNSNFGFHVGNNGFQYVIMQVC